MADVQRISIPAPPDKADLEALHKWALSLYIWLQSMFAGGLQAAFLSQAQIDQITQLSDSGKIFFNNDTGKFSGSVIEGGAVVIKNFAYE